MGEKEYKDLLRYFQLKEYYDEGNILEEEYEELKEIIKRNKAAKEMELAEMKFYSRKISGEEYQKVVKKYHVIVEEHQKQYIKQI